MLLLAVSVCRAQTAPALTVTSAAPDPSGQTVTIGGSNFGSRPLVTLDLVPVALQFSMDTQIVAAVPVNMMPPGKYLLTVSRGSAPTDSASIQLVLGGAQPTQPAASRPAPAASDTGALPAPADTAAN